jgi:hypothetical protein
MMDALKEYMPFVFAGFSVGVATTALLCHTLFLVVAIQIGFILMAITFFWFAFETIKLEREISNEGDSEEFVESEV